MICQPENSVPLCKFQVILKILSLFISLEICRFHSQWTYICIAGLNRRADYTLLLLLRLWYVETLNAPVLFKDCRVVPSIHVLTLWTTQLYWLVEAGRMKFMFLTLNTNFRWGFSLFVQESGLNVWWKAGTTTAFSVSITASLHKTFFRVGHAAFDMLVLFATSA